MRHHGICLMVIGALLVLGVAQARAASVVSSATTSQAKQVDVSRSESAAGASLGQSIDVSAVEIREIRLESAPRLDDAPSALLKFELLNNGSSAIADLVLSASLVQPPETGVEAPIVTVAGPFIVRMKAALRPKNTFHYEIRLRNISADCDCVPRVTPLLGRVVR
jgi:hypothetical protein